MGKKQWLIIRIFLKNHINLCENSDIDNKKVIKQKKKFKDGFI